MQRLRKLCRNVAFWNGIPGQRLAEYILMGAYSTVAILSLVIGLTAKAGTLFGRAVEHANYAARPELKSIIKELMMASADFSAGASLLIISVALVYWGRRAKKTQREPLASPTQSGPPFLL